MIAYVSYVIKHKTKRRVVTYSEETFYLHEEVIDVFYII